MQALHSSNKTEHYSDARTVDAAHSIRRGGGRDETDTRPLGPGAFGLCANAQRARERVAGDERSRRVRLRKRCAGEYASLSRHTGGFIATARAADRHGSED